MDLLIGLILAIVCAGLFGYSYVTGADQGVKFWLQALLTGGGAIFLGYQNRDKLKSYLAKLIPNKEDQVVPTPTPAPIPVPDVGSLDFTPSATDLKDFSSLTYLKNRSVALGDKKAFETIVELNQKIFSASVTAVPGSAKVEFAWDIDKAVSQ